MYTDPLVLYFLAGGVRAGEQPAPGRFRANCSERASEEALVREGYSPGEEQKTLQGLERLVSGIYNTVD